jgi:glycyl-tRNA synthetase
VNFKNVQQSTRQKVPFGIAQIGKAFRNEITPGQLHLPHARVRADGDAVLRRARQRHGVVRVLEGERLEWHQSLGLDPARLKYHQHTKDELAHYARAAFDVEFDFGGTLGFQEIEGMHNRGDFDLRSTRSSRGRSSSTSTSRTIGATRRMSSRRRWVRIARRSRCS